MARFRCPRCGAVVEGLHDRCPRCNVLFKYRKEDVDLLTPYKAPAVEQPERIEEKPAPEPLPPEPAPVVEEPAPAPVQEEPVVEEEKPVDLTPNNKAKTASLVFGILSFVFAFIFNWNILAIIFGGVAIGKAKKAKPVKATAGKVFGIIGLILGIIGLIFTLFVITIGVLAALGVGGYFIYYYWEDIMALFNGSSAALALFF